MLVALLTVGMFVTVLLLAGEQRGWWSWASPALGGWVRGWTVAVLLAMLVAGGAMAVASRADGGLRAHWPKVLAALLLGVGAPVQVAAGWGAESAWWLLAAGVPVALGTLLSLLPTPLARRVWTILPPFESFTGRDSDIDALHALVASPSADTVRVAVLTGQPGVGKTQLARAYGCRRRG